MTRSRVSTGIGIAMVAGVLALIARDAWRQHSEARADRLAPGIGVPGGPSTTREDLQRTVDRAQETLRRDPDDVAAAVQLADALMRQTRVTGNTRLAGAAEQALIGALHRDPLHYGARRMLATVYLSEHRFREAIREAEQARDRHPRDDWNYGVIGDAHLELGEYDEAFQAFRRMMELRPGAPAYARIAYARELRGNLEGALDAMKLAADATTPHDPESLAWHHAQIGELYWQMGRVKEAQFEYAWADHAFAGHPLAQAGLARVKQAEGDLAGAAAAYERLLAATSAPDIAEKLGEVYAALGRSADASRLYAQAERGWRVDARQPAMLARFLVNHDRDVTEAVTLAEAAAAERHDIFTQDTLAWCYFKAGRTGEAQTAIAQALRTGSRDRVILEHAAVIQREVLRAAPRASAAPADTPQPSMPPPAPPPPSPVRPDRTD